ncbi:hypothetical protein HID58_024796 [Brassica napus]|uniref:Uncharacterized protein n=1 Tax=Brassica napus TaxID=3708 RepID=A0ABQ8CLA5_BRANA|nr:hypothetical protein HID58_024796 [Brassica napus]
MGKIMIREGDEAAAQEDERVGKEPEVERKRDAEPDKKEEKHKALKEIEMINSAAYKEREIQKQEEVKWAGEAERKRVEE